MQECSSEGIATLSKNTAERKPKVCGKTSKFVTGNAFPSRSCPSAYRPTIDLHGARAVWNKVFMVLICMRMEDN